MISGVLECASCGAGLTANARFCGAAVTAASSMAEYKHVAAVPTDPGFVLHELPLMRMRALVAKAERDAGSYREHVERYRHRADTVGFEGHIAAAAAM
jgi:adenylate cyclase